MAIKFSLGSFTQVVGRGFSLSKKYLGSLGKKVKNNPNGALANSNLAPALAVLEKNGSLAKVRLFYILLKSQEKSPSKSFSFSKVKKNFSNVKRFIVKNKEIISLGILAGIAFPYADMMIFHKLQRKTKNAIVQHLFSVEHPSTDFPSFGAYLKAWISPQEWLRFAQQRRVSKYTVQLSNVMVPVSIAALTYGLGYGFGYKTVQGELLVCRAEKVIQIDQIKKLLNQVERLMLESSRMIEETSDKIYLLDVCQRQVEFLIKYVSRPPD